MTPEQKRIVQIEFEAFKRDMREGFADMREGFAGVRRSLGALKNTFNQGFDMIEARIDSVSASMQAGTNTLIAKLDRHIQEGRARLER